MAHTALPTIRPIKLTTSLCPVCRRQIDAQVVEREGSVYLNKICPEHGPFNVLISSDRRFYHESVGAGRLARFGEVSEHPFVVLQFVLDVTEQVGGLGEGVGEQEDEPFVFVADAPECEGE